jgi:hypothetical protein
MATNRKNIFFLLISGNIEKKSWEGVRVEKLFILSLSKEN